MSSFTADQWMQQMVIKELPRCKHDHALCDWGGNRTAYCECQPTQEQEKQIAIIKLGNRRDL